MFQNIFKGKKEPVKETVKGNGVNAKELEGTLSNTEKNKASGVIGVSDITESKKSTYREKANKILRFLSNIYNYNGNLLVKEINDVVYVEVRVDVTPLIKKDLYISGESLKKAYDGKYSTYFLVNEGRLLKNRDYLKSKVDSYISLFDEDLQKPIYDGVILTKEESEKLTKTVLREYYDEKTNQQVVYYSIYYKLSDLSDDYKEEFIDKLTKQKLEVSYSGVISTYAIDFRKYISNNKTEDLRLEIGDIYYDSILRLQEILFNAYHVLDYFPVELLEKYLTVVGSMLTKLSELELVEEYSNKAVLTELSNIEVNTKG